MQMAAENLIPRKTQKIMAKYRLYKNKNVKSTGYNKYYAKKAAGKLIGMEGLVQHMAGHNSPYSKGLLMGIVTDMVECVRELAYEGNQVKIDNLGIFQVSLKSKGVANPNDFNASTDITSKWQVRPTGDGAGKKIGVTRAGGAEIHWEEDNNYESPRTPDDGD